MLANTWTIKWKGTSNWNAHLLGSSATRLKWSEKSENWQQKAVRFFMQTCHTLLFQIYRILVDNNTFFAGNSFLIRKGDLNKTSILHGINRKRILSRGKKPLEWNLISISSKIDSVRFNWIWKRKIMILKWLIIILLTLIQVFESTQHWLNTTPVRMFLNKLWKGSRIWEKKFKHISSSYFCVAHIVILY